MGFNKYWTFTGVEFPGADVEVRQDLVFETSYRWINPTGVCSNPGCDEDKDLTVTKHHHARHPQGHLRTRCPKHQQEFEARYGR
jgi:hypothetical protein